MATQYSEPATGRDKDDTDEGTGQDQGFWGSLRHDVASDYDTANNAVTRGLKDADLAKDDPFNRFFGGDSSTPAVKPDDKKKDPAPAPSAEQTDAESTYEQLANAQAEQYLQDTKAIAPYTSGQAIPSFDSSMTSGAEKMLGTSQSSPISQWLNQQVQAAQAQYAPTAAAGATVAQAEQTGQQLVAGGLQQMGQAETAVMQAAPYESLLQSLATDVPYKLLDNYNFSSLSKNVPAAVQKAETNLGITTAGQGTGVGSAPNLGTPTTNPASTSSLLQPDTPSAGGQ